MVCVMPPPHQLPPVDETTMLLILREILWNSEDFRPRVPAHKIDPGHRLVEDLGADSVAIMDLALGLEARLGRAVDEAELALLSTVGAIARKLAGG